MLIEIAIVMSMLTMALITMVIGIVAVIVTTYIDVDVARDCDVDVGCRHWRSSDDDGDGAEMVVKWMATILFHSLSIAVHQL